MTLPLPPQADAEDDSNTPPPDEFLLTQEELDALEELAEPGAIY